MNEDTLALSGDDGRPQRSESDAQKELPGHILQAKRQELRLSVEDVAHSLHLAPRQIQALEADNYDALPGLATSRGFLRSYAKLLKLDPVPLLQMLATESDWKAEGVSLRRALPDKPFYVNRSLTLDKKSGTWVRSGIGLLLCLLAGLLLAWAAGWLPAPWVKNIQDLLSANGILEQADDQHRSDRSTLQARPVQAAVSSDASTTSPESAKNTPVVDAISPASMHAVEVQSDVSPDRASQPISGKLDEKDMLVLKLREDSWIEVRNADDKVLLARLAKAGESEAIPVRALLKLTIGNAAGVDARLRGVPLELRTSAKSNVARLTVN